MKNKSIKNLVKVVIFSLMVVVLNVINILPSFASDSLYVSNATVDNNGNTIIEYNNGSWYSYNNYSENYIFSSIDSQKKEKFNFLYELDYYKNKYEYDQNRIELLKDNDIIFGYAKHSDIIYSDNLSTNIKLEQYAKKWLKDNYNIELTIPIYFSNLDNYDNGFFSEYKNHPYNIEINDDLIGMDLITEKVLIHELTHFALFQLGKDFDDGTENFNKECVKNGSNTNDYKIGFLSSHLESTKCDIIIK